MSSKEQEFALYIDESGSPKPNLKDQALYFGVGGALIKRQNETEIYKKISDFKKNWQIPEGIPLHGNEIRACKKNFAWLGQKSKQDQAKFMDDLTNTIIQCPIIFHACVVSRKGYMNRYFDQYGEDTWEMMKSAFSILIERAAKYVAQEGGKLMVYFEQAGKTEDNLLKNYFSELRLMGHPFNEMTSARYQPLAGADLSKILVGVEGKPKSNSILQVADLCLYPVVRSRDQPDNLAFQALVQNKLLIDTVLPPEHLSSMGIKYYCFEESL